MTTAVGRLTATSAAQRRTILQGFLWTMFAVLVLAIVTVMIVERPTDVLGRVGPNLVMALGVAAALTLNYLRRTSAALALIIVFVLVATSLPVLLGGVAANDQQLTLYFLPLVLAGLTGDRRALYLTVGSTAAVILLGAVGPGGGRPNEWSAAYQFLAIYALVTFTIDRFGLSLQAALTAADERELDLRAARADLEALNEDLERRVAERTSMLQDANRELEAFSYSVSHDLRSPLRAINGFAQILREEEVASLSPAGVEHLDLISENAKQMGQLIDDLLAFSRLTRQPVNRQELDMNELVRVTMGDLASDLAGRQVEFVIDDLPPTQGDPHLVRQLLVNLLSNAVKFTSRREHARIEVRSVAESTHPTYAVIDNGAGFDMRYVDKMFGVFQRLHSVEEFPGTGVGLALVQRIVARHGGTVTAHGEPGVGATFTFSLGGV